MTQKEIEDAFFYYGQMLGIVSRIYSENEELKKERVSLMFCHEKIHRLLQEGAEAIRTLKSLREINQDIGIEE